MVTRKIELSVARTAGVWDVERAGGGAWETAWLNSFKQTDEDEEREALIKGESEAGDGPADNSCWEKTFTLPL
jgi:hypothetical protein